MVEEDARKGIRAVRFHTRRGGAHPLRLRILICDTGTRLLREKDAEIRILRDVNTPLFERLKGTLPDVLQRCCQFVFEQDQQAGPLD